METENAKGTSSFQNSDNIKRQNSPSIYSALP